MSADFFTNDDFLDYSIGDLYPHFWKKDNKLNVQPCEMSKFENAFLVGLIKKYNPLTILEVGLAAGATTTMILETIRKYELNSSLVSLDLNKLYYRDKNFDTCFLAKHHFNNCNFWNLILGYYLPQIINLENTRCDLCILDTVHAFPGELLDLIAILPFMNNGGIIVLHDINLHMRYPVWNRPVNDYNKNCYVTLSALSTLVGKKIICLDKADQLPPDIGAVIVDDNTKENIKDLFLLLTMPWHYMIGDDEYNIYYDFYKIVYGESYAKFFTMARNQNIQRIKWLQKK